MPLKYEKEIVTRKGCDLARFTERDRPAFCFAFDPITDTKNFVPRALAIKHRDNCGSWGLSFFETQKQAEDKLNNLTAGKPNLFKYIGTHIASGMLNKTDGISEDCDQDGHFNIHEYTDTNFHGKFTNIKRVA